MKRSRRGFAFCTISLSFYVKYSFFSSFIFATQQAETVKITQVNTHAYHAFKKIQKPGHNKIEKIKREENLKYLYMCQQWKYKEKLSIIIITVLKKYLAIFVIYFWLSIYIYFLNK